MRLLGLARTMSDSVSASPAPCVLLPGNLDGVHRGHRHLIQIAQALATQLELPLRALFFDPHPMAVLAQTQAPGPLSLPARRQRLLAQAGVAEVQVQTFTRAFAQLTAEQFFRDYLLGRYAARGVVIGEDFCFGRERIGTVSWLEARAQAAGLALRVVRKAEDGGEVISSSRIRAALAEGDCEAATRLLGRYHDLGGTVVHGEKRGRSLGFPTANLATDGTLLPADGVYAVWLRRADGKLLPGVANLGARPTVNAAHSFEVHVLEGLSEEIYGEELRVYLVSRLREVRRFADLDALKAAIRNDSAQARALLDGAGQTHALT